MAIEIDEEILQDFLTEAGEIIEALSGQLVDLERRPDDKDLLNSIFRGFHTVKGGGGFLGADSLVEICHHTEDLFNLLRQGKLAVDADLMDYVLQALDTVKAMTESLRSKKMPDHAPPALIAAIKGYVEQVGTKPTPKAGKKKNSKSSSTAAAAADATPADKPSDIVTDEEFEMMLDALHGAPASASATTEDRMPVLENPIVDDKPVQNQSDSVTEIKLGDFDGAKTETPTEATVRVDTQSLDTIMNLVGELVLVRNRLATLREAINDPRLTQTVSSLDLITADLQTAVMKTRMQPIKKIFSRFPRVIRDLSRTLGKETELELVGEDTELDKNLVEALADPMVHLVRNAVDHGLETPEVRLQNGKSRVGHLLLAAQQAGDHIVITISDDGAGIDSNVIRTKAVEKGLVTTDQAARMDTEECLNLIFAPGFSTKAQISDISGRGVGLDVVKTRITQLSGTVEVQSEQGVGTTIIIRLPLTLAILPTLMVRVDGRPFAIPLSSVEDILKLDTLTLRRVDGQDVAMVRDQALPLLFLRDWLLVADSTNQLLANHVVTVHIGSRRMGLVVDDVMGQEEVVIKPLGALLHGLPGYAGATITGDGRIALILDVPGVVASRDNRV